MYTTKEIEMANHIYSIHAKIWSQCTEPLQNMIKHLDEFTMKHKEKYVLCLLNNLKTLPIGIYYLGNKRVDYFNDLKSFVNMIQGRLEGYDGYIKRARSAIENLI